MKPLTIEELKALEVGDWVWVEWETQDPIDWRNVKQKAYFKIIEPENSDSIRFNNFVPMNYSDYGKTLLAYKNKEQAEEEQCANCDRNISDELPKVDIDGKRYCGECYGDKCKGDAEVNRLYAFVIDREEIYRFICKNTTQALLSFTINISTIDWLRKDRVSYGGDALMVLKSYALSEQGLGDEKIEGFMFVKKQQGELIYYPCGKGVKMITSDVYASFYTEIGEK